MSNKINLEDRGLTSAQLKMFTPLCKSLELTAEKNMPFASLDLAGTKWHSGAFLIFEVVDFYGYEFHAEIDGVLIFKKKPEDLFTKFDSESAIKGTIPPEFGSAIINKS